jgi:leucine dehydrogenase
LLLSRYRTAPVKQSGSALQALERLGHEEVVLAHDAAASLRAVIAVHDTTLGPAVGGTRMRLYPRFDDAVTDALRLSRAMTYKAVMAGMPYGGGKAVIVGDPAKDKTRALFAAYAKTLERLGGRFHTGCDMGMDGRDIAVLARMTKYVSHTAPGSKIDTADLAALGVHHGLKAAARRLGKEVSGLRVAIQGIGQLGYRLAKLLAAEGARLEVSDVDPGRVERAKSELGAKPRPPNSIASAECDVFSPNAAGGILNGRSIPKLRCRAVVGGANEQLHAPEHGDALAERGILYAPDYVANAGGLLSLLYEKGETDEAGVLERVRGIAERLEEIWSRSERENVAPHRIADRIVEERLAEARAKKKR